jgi:hypothetical protein
MSLTGWYFQKAEQCKRLAKTATHPDCRARYEEEQKSWLEIAATIERDEDKRFGPEPR